MNLRAIQHLIAAMVARACLLALALSCCILAGAIDASASAASSANAWRPHAGPSHAAVSRARNRSGLRIVVTALPHGLSPRIVVLGPHKIRRTVVRGGVLRLRPGRYVVSATAVPGASGTYYATVPKLKTRIRRGHIATVKVSYATLIPKNTHVVPTSGTAALTGSPEGARVLTLTGPAAATASAGQFLASGPSSAAPDGYLLKVLSVEHNGETASLQVENATLTEAVPAGELNIERTLEPPAGTASMASSSTLNAWQYGSGAPSAHAAGFSLPAASLKCTTSAGAHLTPRVDFSPHISFHAEWGLFSGLKASFTAGVHESISISAGVEAGASCETKDPGIGLLPHPIQLPDIDIQVGPVPVVIVPKLQVYLYGKVEVKASLTASVEQSAQVTVGVNYDKGNFTPIQKFSSQFGKSFTPQGDAEGEIALRPTLDALFYDAAGPSFDIGAALEFHADTTENPWWDLKGCAQAGVGFIVDVWIIKKDWSDPKLLDFCKTLLSAKGGFPGSSGTSGAGGGSGGSGGSSGSGGGSGGGNGGGGSTGGSGGEPGGGLCKRWETVGFETKCVET